MLARDPVLGEHHPRPNLVFLEGQRTLQERDPALLLSGQEQRAPEAAEVLAYLATLDPLRDFLLVLLFVLFFMESFQ